MWLPVTGLEVMKTEEEGCGGATQCESGAGASTEDRVDEKGSENGVALLGRGRGLYEEGTAFPPPPPPLC